MSKITRKQIMQAIDGHQHVYQQIDAVEDIINQREEEFAALVDAVSHAHKIQSEPPDVEKAMLALAAIFKAHREIMSPPQSPADRLDALADNEELYSWLIIELRAIAAELREEKS